MATSTIQQTIYPETQCYGEARNVTFSGGAVVIAPNSGWLLANAITMGRSSSEANIYAVDSIQRQTDGYYRITNKNTSLSAGLTLLLIWIKA